MRLLLAVIVCLIANAQVTSTAGVHPAMYGRTITNSIRGANFLHGFHNFTAGAPFDQAVDALGIEYIRWPGGSLTEEFTPNYLMSTLFPRVRTLRDSNVWEALEYCRRKGKRMFIVLPTEPFTPPVAPFTPINENAVLQVGACLTTVLAYNPGVVAGLLIGNEYWAEEAPPNRYLVMVNRCAERLSLS